MSLSQCVMAMYGLVVGDPGRVSQVLSVSSITSYQVKAEAHTCTTALCHLQYVRHKMKRLFLLILVSILVTACSPELGSEKWCSNFKEKPAGDWTTNEVKDYAKHCSFK